jgi:hypothetical protein
MTLKLNRSGSFQAWISFPSVTGFGRDLPFATGQNFAGQTVPSRQQRFG